MIKNSYKLKRTKFKGIKKKWKKEPLIIKKIALLNIHCTSNNTLVYLQYMGKSSLNISTGTVGLKGAKRSTVHAARQTLLLAIEKLKEHKIKSVIVFFKGFGRGRRSVIKSLKKYKIKILRIFDKTCIAHNGCRPPKKRRL